MELEERVRLLESKVQSLEQEIYHLTQNKQVPHGIGTQLPIKQSPPREPREPREPEPPIDWEHLIARVWLPRIFIFVLLLGVLWGFSAAVTAGIITRPVRIMLGLLASGLMIWFGESQMKHKRVVLGQVLLGGAVSVLMLTLFAAHMLYDYLPYMLAFILNILVIASFVALGVRHRSQTITLLSVFGGYLVPFLVVSSNPNLWLFCGYEALFSLAIIYVSLRYEFKISYYLSLAMLHFTLLLSYVFSDGHQMRAPFLIAIFVQHVVLTLLFLRSNRFMVNQTVTLLTSFSVTALWFAILYADNALLTYQILIGVSALIYTALASWATIVHRETKPVLMTVASFACFLWLMSVLDIRDYSLAILIEGALALSLGLWLNSKLQITTGGILYAIGFMMTFFEPITDILSKETLSWLILMLSIILLHQVSHRLSPSHFVKTNKGYLLWTDSILFLFFLTYITNVLTEAVSTDSQHLILTSVWTLYAIAAIVIGFIFKRKTIRLTGISFLFITLIKLIFIDIPDVSLAIRAILFMGLGAIGIILSRLFYKK